ncbi:MAG: O-methyltransferase [Candidatus Acidiferrales bacterium]
MAGEITGKAVEKYIYEILPARDSVLADMEKAATKEDIPIIGPAVGRMMYLLAQISGAKRIFEMGSAIGYSTIWLARAAGPKAEIYYTDGDPKNAKRATEFFKRAGVEKRIRVMTGDALAMIDRVRGNFDLIFIDVDKHQYPAALQKAVRRLKHGGILVTDNTLWSGRVTRKADSAETRGVQEFNRLVYGMKEMFPVMIPLRDGVTVCRKS